MARPKIAVLISGRGSNMLAIARACSSGELDADIALVLSNRADAAGISAAQDLGLATKVIEHAAYATRERFDCALTESLETVDPDWIALAGFMRILGHEFVARWQGKILNIHPSLLPLYPGLNTHERAIQAGDTEAGATVHVVTAELDMGPIIAQARVPVRGDDTPETLAARVIETEHELYVNALKQCVTNTSV